QAEDGIRDYKVTGVQTCALPISGFDLAVSGSAARFPGSGVGPGARVDTAGSGAPARRSAGTPKPVSQERYPQSHLVVQGPRRRRSEERRVGKECRSRTTPEQVK